MPANSAAVMKAIKEIDEAVQATLEEGYFSEEIETASDVLMDWFGFPKREGRDRLLQYEHRKLIVIAVGEFFKDLVRKGRGHIRAVRTICFSKKGLREVGVDDEDDEEGELEDNFDKNMFEVLKPGATAYLGDNWSFDGHRFLGDPCGEDIIATVTTTFSADDISWDAAVGVNATTSAGFWGEREIHPKRRMPVVIEKVHLSRSWPETRRWTEANCRWADSDEFFEEWVKTPMASNLLKKAKRFLVEIDDDDEGFNPEDMNEELYQVFSKEPIIPEMLRAYQHRALAAAIRTGDDFDTDWFPIYQNWYRHVDAKGRIARSGSTIECQVAYKDERGTEAYGSQKLTWPVPIHPDRLVPKIVKALDDAFRLARDEYGQNKKQRIEAEHAAFEERRIQENEATTKARAGQVGPGMKGFVDNRGYCVAWEVDARREPGHIDMLEDYCRPRVITEYLRRHTPDDPLVRGDWTIAELYGLRPETNSVFFHIRGSAGLNILKDYETVRMIVSCFSGISPDTTVIAHHRDVRYRSRADDLVNWERFWDISMRKPRWEEGEK